MRIIAGLFWGAFSGKNKSRLKSTTVVIAVPNWSDLTPERKHEWFWKLYK